MRKLNLTRQAKAELAAIREYTIENYGYKQAQKYLDSIQGICQLLQANPFMGYLKNDLSEVTYTFPVESHMIYYSFDNQNIYLLAILHKNMLPKEHL